MNDQPPKALCSWPGLAGLWLQGRWTSLLLAVGFSLVLNLALVSTFVWPALLGSTTKMVLWPTLLVIWLVGAWNSWRLLNRSGKKGSESRDKSSPATDDTLFIQAQTEYLKGDLTQAESLLVRQLQLDSRDVETRLLLASIYGRSRRIEKATRQLEMLGRLDESRPWKFEIGRLRNQLQTMSPSTEIETDELSTDVEHSPNDDEFIEDENPDGIVKLGQYQLIRDHDPTQTEEQTSQDNRRAA